MPLSAPRVVAIRFLGFVASVRFFVVAAQLTPQDVSLWKRCGLMAKQEGKLDQAVYCLKRAARNSASPEGEVRTPSPYAAVGSSENGIKVHT